MGAPVGGGCSGIARTKKGKGVERGEGVGDSREKEG